MRLNIDFERMKEIYGDEIEEIINENIDIIEKNIRFLNVTRPTVIGLHKCGNFRFICFIFSAYFRYIYNNRKKDCHLSNEWQYLSTFC